MTLTVTIRRVVSTDVVEFPTLTADDLTTAWLWRVRSGARRWGGVRSTRTAARDAVLQRLTREGLL